MLFDTFALANSHKLLAKLIRAGIAPPASGSPVTMSAKSVEHAMQVVITIAHYAPARIAPEVLARIDAMRESRLTPQQQRILTLLAGQPARKATWIAAKLGKQTADGGLRHTLANMLRNGFLVKGADGRGYRLPPTSEASA